MRLRPGLPVIIGLDQVVRVPLKAQLNFITQAIRLPSQSLFPEMVSLKYQVFHRRTRWSA